MHHIKYTDNLKIMMTGQERGVMVSKEINVHEVGGHLRSTKYNARRAGNLLPSALSRVTRIKNTLKETQE